MRGLAQLLGQHSHGCNLSVGLSRSRAHTASVSRACHPDDVVESVRTYSGQRAAPEQHACTRAVRPAPQLAPRCTGATRAAGAAPRREKRPLALRLLRAGWSARAWRPGARLGVAPLSTGRGPGAAHERTPTGAVRPYCTAVLTHNRRVVWGSILSTGRDRPTQTHEADPAAPAGPCSALQQLSGRCAHVPIPASRLRCRAC